MVRSLWISAMRGTRTLLDRTGVTRRLEGSTSFAANHARTMLSIYDVADMASLDVPWWTYRAAARVEDFLAARDGRARIFEWGSGASTVWLGRRAASVVSVEHDEQFTPIVQGLVSDMPHVEVLHVPPVPAASPAVPSGRRGMDGLDFSDYVAAIDKGDGPFDLIVIDGRARDACLGAARSRLAEGGLVVFDNANRRRYRPALDAWSGAKELHWGAAPALPYRSCTALLFA